MLTKTVRLQLLRLSFRLNTAFSPPGPTALDARPADIAAAAVPPGRPPRPRRPPIYSPVERPRSRRAAAAAAASSRCCSRARARSRHCTAVVVVVGAYFARSATRYCASVFRPSVVNAEMTVVIARVFILRPVLSTP